MKNEQLTKDLFDALAAEAKEALTIFASGALSPHLGAESPPMARMLAEPAMTQELTDWLKNSLPHVPSIWQPVLLAGFSQVDFEGLAEAALAGTKLFCVEEGKNCKMFLTYDAAARYLLSVLGEAPDVLETGDQFIRGDRTYTFTEA